VITRQTTRVLRRVRWMVALVAAGASAMAGAQEPGEDTAAVDLLLERAYSEELPLESGRGWSLAIDNDLFAPTQSDRDYTGGVGITVSGPQTADYWWSLDPLLRRIDRLLIPGGHSPRSTVNHAVQVGLVSFTPQDLVEEDVNLADRPYASMLFVTGSRQYVAPDARSVRYSDLTLGVLGLSITSDIHNAVHRAIGSDIARGYAHQVSAGGEPTARYVTGGARLRAQRLALGSRLVEAKTTWELSAGYLTEMSYAVSARLGDIDSSWWTFTPERVDYIAQPSPVDRRSGRGLSELYVWAGAKARLRAYNAFLQGQFRHSDHRFGASDVNHLIGEVWLGITGRTFGGTQLSYAMRYQTAEIREGLGSRDPVWAGITISHSF
jgi:Uncharacterized protein conserved in bacteria (DUF2219)